MLENKPDNTTTLLKKVREADPEAVGSFWSRIKNKLQAVIRREDCQSIQRRCDLSDIRGEALLEAVQAFPKFRGRSSLQLGAWLRIIGRRMLSRLRRKHIATGRRSLKREDSMDQARDGGGRLVDELADNGPTPSEVAVRDEQATHLRELVARMPDENWRRAVELHFLEHLSVAQIASELSCTKGQAAGNLRRGIDWLRSNSDGDDRS